MIDRGSRSAIGLLTCLVIVSTCAIVVACADYAAVRSPHYPKLNSKHPWSYILKLEPGSSNAVVTACFPPVQNLVLAPPSQNSKHHLVSAHSSKGHTLEVRDGQIHAGSNSCVRYRVDLRTEESFEFAWHSGTSMVIPSSAWLWRPSPFFGLRKATLRVIAPYSVYAPWKKDSDEYTLDESAFRFVSYLGLGTANRIDGYVDTQTVRIDTHIYDMDAQIDQSAVLQTWLHNAVHNVLQLRPEPQFYNLHVFVVSVESSEAGILFGTVGRGGGASVVFFVSDTVKEKNFTKDWVATHELAHLMLPYVSKRAMWFSEGLATYFQEILPAQRGLRSDQQTWSRLLAGFRAGRINATGRTLQQETRDVLRTFAFRRVYWTGAFMALQADVATRQQLGVKQGLQRQIQQIPACCGPQDKVWKAKDLVDRLDAMTPQPVWQPIVQSQLHSSTFPDPGALLSALGVVLGSNKSPVNFRDAPHANIRNALTSLPPTATQEQYFSP